MYVSLYHCVHNVFFNTIVANTFWHCKVVAVGFMVKVRIKLCLG